MIRVAVGGPGRPGQSSEAVGHAPDVRGDEPARACMDEVSPVPELLRNRAAVEVDDEMLEGPTGGSAERAAAPIVVIDLEAGVMVEEVDSDE